MAKRRPRGKKRPGRPGFLGRALLVGLAIVFLVAGWFGYFALAPLKAAPDTVFLIEKGASLSAVARKLESQGLVEPAWSFILMGRGLGMAGRIKAGSYQMGDTANAYQLLRKITEGDTLLGKVTIVEGWTFRQMRAALNAREDLRHDSADLDEAALMARIGARETSAEGRFFPDTYYYDHGASDLDLYRRAYRTMQSRLQAAWDSRVPGLPYTTPDQVLTMASIIEKETGAPEERALIASVFVNRLRIGMRLQTDPTVIYGVGESFDGNLRKSDLLRDTPYNTYTRSGLPPGPIALPGGDALQAAVNPEASRYLYFVAKGGGRHQFSTNLDDHNRAVNRYQRGR